MWSHAGLLLYLAALAASQEQPSSSTPIDVPTTTSPLTSTHSSASAATSSTITTGTCEARSINYVTHTLLQQCLGRTYSPYSTPTTNATVSGTPSGHHTDATPTHGSANNTHASINDTANATDAHEPVAAETSQSATSTVAALSATPLAVSADAEAESLLDNAKFLSFEDWKKQNLVEKGFPDNVGSNKPAAGEGEARKRPGINNALDGFGEDAEIEIDFGFGTYEPVKQASNAARTDPDSNTAHNTAQAPKTRSKDAGKTCKERTNYASFDCAASILKTNPKCKSSTSVLVENKDSYMLNECSQDNKFLIVELCEGVLIDTLVLANFEFFSSMFRTFRVSVSDRYPVKIDKWVDLGTYEARNSRDIQPFLIENPQIFARYLRIEFLTHYGSEYYCPLSLIRAHGITMFEQYRMEQQFLSGDTDDGDEEDVPVASPAMALSVPSTVVKMSKELQNAIVTSDKPADGSSGAPPSAPSPTDQPGTAVTASPPEDPVPSNTQGADAASSQSTSSGGFVEESTTSPSVAVSTPAPVTDAPSISDTAAGAGHNTSISVTAPMTERPSTTAGVSSQVPQANVTSAPSSTASASSVLQDNFNTTLPLLPSSTSSSLLESSSPSQAAVASSNTSSIPSSSTQTTVTSSASTYTASTTPAAAAAAPPATQESFFKSIHKRLSFLEANSTLSLQYIEAQSQLLREAFSKVEKRNVATTSKFLELLNSTVLAEMARFKGEYEQLWQSTVLELASQRDEGRRERDLLGERVRSLGEEMVSQKRLMAAQAILLLLCLSIVVFAKFGTAGIDSSLMQGMQELVMMRSRRTQGHKHKDSTGSLSLGRRWPWESPWASPPRSRDITRPHTASGHEHSLSTELQRELLDEDADLESHRLGRGSQSPDSQGHGGGHTSNSDVEELPQDRVLSIRFSPGVNNSHDGVDDRHGNEDFDDDTIDRSRGAAIGLGLKPLHPDGGAKLVVTRSAPNTPRLADCSSSGSDASKT